MDTFMSLPFLSINFYDTVFFAIYMIITIGLFIYKTQKYPFPQYAVAMQSILLTLFALSHYMRYQLAKMGIAQKFYLKILFYIIITLFLIALYVFQLRLQTYVTLGDWVLNWVGLALSVIETIGAIWVFLVYQKSKKSH
jgi:hypothetical protein